MDPWKWYEPNTIKISKQQGSSYVGFTGAGVRAGDRDVSRFKECIAK